MEVKIKNLTALLWLFFLSYNYTVTHAQSPLEDKKFITVAGQQLIKDGKPYHFIGTNLWYGMNLGMPGKDGDRDRLLRELDELKGMGVNNLRIMGSSEGPDTEPLRVVPSLQPAPGQYNEMVQEGLDFLLYEMGKRDMYAVVCINNFWSWTGGMAQYRSWASNNEAIPYPPPAENGDWSKFQKYSSHFYENKKANRLLKNHLNYLLNHVNKFTGVKYKDDPTIMAWQLGNEPRGYQNVKKYRTWLHKTAKYIKSLDKNHLVSTGAEGNTSSNSAGTNFLKDNGSKYIDYTTIHIWIQNWSWFNPEKDEETMPAALKKAKKYLHDHAVASKKLNKPMVLEEFGVSRDKGDHHPEASATFRDMFYEVIFEEAFKIAEKDNGLAGCNFWSWAGEGRSQRPGEYWQEGDDLIGDPPHEQQGWYSVYDKDHSTLNIIKKYAELFNKLGIESKTIALGEN